MTNKSRYKVRLINGEVIRNLTYDESMEYFYSHAGSVVSPDCFKEYKAP